MKQSPTSQWTGFLALIALLAVMILRCITHPIRRADRGLESLERWISDSF